MNKKIFARLIRFIYFEHVFGIIVCPQIIVTIKRREIRITLRVIQIGSGLCKPSSRWRMRWRERIVYVHAVAVKIQNISSCQSDESCARIANNDICDRVILSTMHSLDRVLWQYVHLHKRFL